MSFSRNLLLPPHCAPTTRPSAPDRLARVAALDVDQTLHRFLVQKAHLKLFCSFVWAEGEIEFVAPLLQHLPPCPVDHRGLLARWGGEVDTPASPHGFSLGCSASCPGSVRGASGRGKQNI